MKKIKAFGNNFLEQIAHIFGIFWKGVKIIIYLG